MNKTYHFKIFSGALSMGYDTIEECVEECKKTCECLGIDYNDREVKLFLTNDFGETYEECTEEGELAG